MENFPKIDMASAALHLEGLVGNDEEMLKFGKKHGFVANFRSFYEDDRVIPEMVYPLEAKYVDGFEGCPDIDGTIKDACAAVGIGTIEYDDYIYLDTPRNRKLLAAWKKNN